MKLNDKSDFRPFGSDTGGEGTGELGENVNERKSRGQRRG